MAVMKNDPYFTHNYNPSLEANYNIGEISLHSNGGHKAVYLDSMNDFKVVMSGWNLKYSHGELMSGTVNKIGFFDDFGHKLAIIDTFKHEASSFADAILGSHGIGGLLKMVLNHNDKLYGTGNYDYLAGRNGNDVLKGWGGNDDILGNKGNDKLWGGKGDDIFQFYAHTGHDIIKDFNVGNDIHFDTLYIRDVGFDTVKSGHDTMIEFHDGGTLLLEDVRYWQVGQIHFDAVL